MRVSGQRRYAADAVSYVAVLRLAQACGFRLEEMRQLLNGFGAGVKPSRRWQELALRKQEELDMKMAQLKAMRRLLDRVAQWQCLEIRECGRMAASVMESAR